MAIFLELQVVQGSTWSYRPRPPPWYPDDMTESADEIMEHLLHIRSAIDDMRQDMRELKSPLDVLENRYVSLSNQLDRIDSRLDLTDA
jgi:hypothetical protein